MQKSRWTRIRLCLVPAMVIIAGCATARIDWDSRLGTYTFVQAVSELGPPDRQTKLSDGQVVAEWVSRYYDGGTTMVGADGYHDYPGGAGGGQTGPAFSESTLCLTFTTNNVLADWSKQ